MSHVSRVRKLYKLILRLHRGLPEDLRILGDNYAREEFKRHKKCRPAEAQIFLNEWRDYALNMSRQAAPSRAQRPAAGGNGAAGGSGAAGNARPAVAGGVDQRYGADLSPGRLVQLSPEQLLNLYILHVNARGHNIVEEEIDSGIDLVDSDVLVRQLEAAKRHIVNVAATEQEKLARGELKQEDLTLMHTSWWMELLDEAMATKDKEDEAKAREEMAKEDK